MKHNIYITTPIYYVNGRPHIGHAYTSIVSDFLARFYKKNGNEIFFLTGTDEHGQKVAQSAEKNGLSSIEFCDSISQIFRNLAEKFHITHDDFIRTTEKRHTDFVQTIWQKLEKNGWIYKDTYKGWYSIRDEAFYDESEIVNGKAPTGAEVSWREEESYFFKLSAFTQPLLDFYEKTPSFVFPNGRFNEVKSFVRGVLNDLSISRSTFSWGIEIPETNHVMYVWLDALFNYQSALDSAEKFEKFWKNGKIMHIIGKDILRFHAVYWPAFLAGLNCTPETISGEILEKSCSNMQIISHGWWLSDGEKMSKSLGNTIDPFELVEKYGVEYIRYFLLREAQFGSDGNFSQSAFATRITSELINNVGNLCQRTFTLTHKNCNSKVPSVTVNHPLLEAKLHEQMAKFIEEFKFNQAIEVVLNYSSKANEFIQETKPWELFKQGKQKEGEEVIFVLLHTIFEIKNAFEAILPEFSAKISQVFNNENFSSGVKLNPLEKVFQQLPR